MSENLTELAAVIAANLNDVTLLANGDRSELDEATTIAKHIQSQVKALGADQQVLWRLHCLVECLEIQDPDERYNPDPLDFSALVLAVHGAFALQLKYLDRA